jgi:hypothetical protein
MKMRCKTSISQMSVEISDDAYPSVCESDDIVLLQERAGSFVPDRFEFFPAAF